MFRDTIGCDDVPQSTRMPGPCGFLWLLQSQLSKLSLYPFPLLISKGIFLKEKRILNTNYVKVTSKSLTVHSATSSLSLTKISVPMSMDLHILLAGGVPGSCSERTKMVTIWLFITFIAFTPKRGCLTTDLIEVKSAC